MSVRAEDGANQLYEEPENNMAYDFGRSFVDSSRFRTFVAIEIEEATYTRKVCVAFPHQDGHFR
jgi:hypothetical protein